MRIARTRRAVATRVRRTDRSHTAAHIRQFPHVPGGDWTAWPARPASMTDSSRKSRVRESILRKSCMYTSNRPWSSYREIIRAVTAFTIPAADFNSYLSRILVLPAASFHVNAGNYALIIRFTNRRARRINYPFSLLQYRLAYFVPNIG